MSQMFHCRRSLILHIELDEHRVIELRKMDLHKIKLNRVPKSFLIFWNDIFENSLQLILNQGLIEVPNVIRPHAHATPVSLSTQPKLTTESPLRWHEMAWQFFEIKVANKMNHMSCEKVWWYTTRQM